MENTEVNITAGSKEELTVPLTVEGLEEQVDVSSSEGGQSTRKTMRSNCS